MKIIEHRQIESPENVKVQFLRIKIDDLSTTLSNILQGLMNLSWLSKFDNDFEIAAFESRAKKTIDDIKIKFDNCTDDKITKEAGEYVVSESARKAIVTKLHYLDIPISELLGKKKSGNPGFDFHSQNPDTDTVIFGEAKFQSSNCAYSSALKQVMNFVQDGKDNEDLPELKSFCSTSSLSRVLEKYKGFAICFSVNDKSSDKILEKIKQRKDYQFLLSYSEVILVAVNL